MTVTQFKDMHSGGGTKTPYENIYIEASESDAIDFFKSWFGRDPYRITCSCCGQDFSVKSYDSLQQATGYNRNCEYEDGRYIEKPKSYAGSSRELLTVDELLDKDSVTFFSQSDVESELGRVVE